MPVRPLEDLTAQTCPIPLPPSTYTVHPPHPGEKCICSIKYQTNATRQTCLTADSQPTCIVGPCVVHLLDQCFSANLSQGSQGSARISLTLDRVLTYLDALAQFLS